MSSPVPHHPLLNGVRNGQNRGKGQGLGGVSGPKVAPVPWFFEREQSVGVRPRQFAELTGNDATVL